MVDSTIRGVGLPEYFAQLLPDLVVMVIVDLAMMSLNWEVPIKITQDVGGRHCLVA